MMLHLKAKKSGGWSDKGLDHTVFQAMSIQITVDSMVHTLHNFYAAAEIFFGPYSLLTAGLRSWREAISFNLICHKNQYIGSISQIPLM